MRQTQLTALGSLLACCLFPFSFSKAQEASGPALHIKGSLKGVSDGAAPPGVKVALASHKSIATVTDASGNFAPTIPAGKAGKTVQLEFSSIGFATKLGTLDPGQTEMAVTLESGKSTLNEAVVTPLGISRQTKPLCYSITTVKRYKSTQSRATHIAT